MVKSFGFAKKVIHAVNLYICVNERTQGELPGLFKKTETGLRDPWTIEAGKPAGNRKILASCTLN
jgi:hypothetical protein